MNFLYRLMDFKMSGITCVSEVLLVDAVFVLKCTNDLYPTVASNILNIYYGNFIIIVNLIKQFKCYTLLKHLCLSVYYLIHEYFIG